MDEPSATVNYSDPFGIEYDDFVGEYDAGRLSAFVDRGLAVQAYRLSGSPFVSILPLVFFAGLVSFIPLMVFYSFWAGGIALIAAITARRLLTKKAVNWVRNDALASQEAFEWYRKRRIIWGERVDSGA